MERLKQLEMELKAIRAEKLEAGYPIEHLEFKSTPKKMEGEKKKNIKAYSQTYEEWLAMLKRNG